MSRCWKRDILLLALLIPLSASSLSAGANFGRMLETLTQRFGKASAGSFLQWHTLVTANRQVSDSEKLRLANAFFNQRTQFGDDARIWGKSDYWATPMETLGRRMGDCEDFTIAKYFTLLNMGIANERLRLIYVKASLGGPGGTQQQAHMVLAYYPSPDDEPLVLDNLVDDIRPAGMRTDLQPVFSFNSEGIWAGPGGRDASAGGIGRLSRWQELLLRARNEGF